MAATVFDGIEAIRAAVGTHLGYSDWTDITQERVDQFADATGDHQWVHVDPVRARAESRFGGPVAHGYLTLSLSNELLPQIVEVRGFSMGVNYGVDRIRFPSPVLVGSRVRAGAELLGVTDVKGGIQTTMRITISIEGVTKSACVIDSLSRYFT